jgi:hypothetical protein
LPNVRGRVYNGSIKKGKTMDLDFCVIDDNYTEHDNCAECGEDVCVLCHNAYGCPAV